MKIGRAIQEGWRDLAKKHYLDIHISGIYPLSHFAFEGDNALACKTLFTQLLLEEGFLASTSFYASYAHRQNHVDLYLKAVDRAFQVIHSASSGKDIQQLLKGPIAHVGFHRLA